MSNSYHENLNTDIRHELLNFGPNYCASHLVPYISNLPPSGIISSLWLCSSQDIKFCPTSTCNYTRKQLNHMHARVKCNIHSEYCILCGNMDSLRNFNDFGNLSIITSTHIYEGKSHENFKLHVVRGATIFTLLLRRHVAFLHFTATCRPLFKTWVKL